MPAVEGENCIEKIEKVDVSGGCKAGVVGLLASDLVVGNKFAPLLVNRGSFELQVKTGAKSGEPSLRSDWTVTETVFGWRACGDDPKLGDDLGNNVKGILAPEKTAKSSAGNR